VPRPDAPPNDPFSTNTREAQIAVLKADPLLFAPGTAVLYSNFGYDLLGAALANISAKPYADLLEERVLKPLGMNDTLFNPRPEDQPRLMQGHNFDGSAMPIVPTSTGIGCSGGLYSTANDMLRWISWHVDNQPSTADPELRLVNHAAFLYRDGLKSVVGLDDGGPMDAMGMGWVIMLPKEDRPLILQKSGALQGMFTYVAIAPTRGVGAFFVMNEFNAAAFMAAVKMTNDLVAELAPR
jgi:D-alanyl-D-alanine-carboxypeptidase/D-alanyl-D-alanine-endopeptidase